MLCNIDCHHRCVRTSFYVYQCLCSCVLGPFLFKESDFLFLGGGLAMIHPCADPLLKLFPDLSK
jgi:hypothetical protein